MMQLKKPEILSFRKTSNETQGSADDQHHGPADAQTQGQHFVAQLVLENDERHSLLIYRIRQSRKTIKRYFRQSKVQYEWSFGIIKLTSETFHTILPSLSNNNRHTVKLVQENDKTRVFCDHHNCSDLVQNTGRRGQLDLQWEAPFGGSLRIGQTTQGELSLYVNGIAFYRLPQEEELCPDTMDSQYWQQLARNTDDDVSALNSTDHDDSLYRCTGSSPVSSSRKSTFEDELRSDLYSPKLDNLRETIITALPQADDILSRAIINAFVDGDHYQSGLHHENDFTYQGLDTDHFEVEALAHACTWLDEINHEPGELDLLEQLQIYVDAIFLRVKREYMNSDDASRIILNVASVLGLSFSQAICYPTVLVQGFDLRCNKDSIFHALSMYGTIDALTFSRKGKFACCHFSSEAAADRLIQASADVGIQIDGKTVFCTKVTPSYSEDINTNTEQSENPSRWRMDPLDTACYPEGEDFLPEKMCPKTPGIDTTMDTSSGSPQSFSPPLSTPMSSFGSDFFGLLESPETTPNGTTRKVVSFHSSTSEYI